MSYRIPSIDIDTDSTDNASFHSRASETMSEQANVSGAHYGQPQNTVHEQLGEPSEFEEQQSRSPHQAGDIPSFNPSSPQYQALYNQIIADISRRQPLLNAQNFPHATSTQPQYKKPSKWPSWDGSITTLSSHIYQLIVKVEEDKRQLGSDRAICLGILNSIPVDKQSRVSHWFETGGPSGMHNWKDFVEHIKLEFEDKQARQTAGDLLYRMRMGSNQYFCDFFQDFQVKLAQCGGTNWPDSSKIMKLNSSINESLSDHLVSKDLPDDDFETWVSMVKRVAGRLENRPSYRPTGCTGKKTWYLSHKQSKYHSSTTDRYLHAPDLDDEGDTKMGGVNAIEALKLALNSLNSRNITNKPRAKWRSPEEFKSLCSEGRCVRCREKGHLSRACTKFGPAQNLASRIAYVKGPTKIRKQSHAEEKVNYEELETSEVSGEE